MGIFDDLKNKAKGMGKKAKDLADKLEEQAKKGELGTEISKGVENLVSKAVEGAKSAHEDIKKKGGYQKAAQDALGKLEPALDSLYGRVDEAYNSFESAFFTNGELDKEKAKSALANAADITRRYGSKAAENLSRLLSDGIDSARESYASLVPSKEEREGRYKCMGRAYEGKIFFKNDFELCLKFKAKAKKTIPGSLESKGLILNDITASASKNISELMEYYSLPSLENDSFLEVKKEISRKYLK